MRLWIAATVQSPEGMQSERFNPQVHSAEWEGEAPGLPNADAIPRSIARR